jgi:predicted amidohydrolase
MKPIALRIAIAQPLVVPGNVRENLRRMRPLVAEARRRGAALTLFSETGLTGNDQCGASLQAAIPLEHPALDMVAHLARANRMAIVNGFYERRHGSLYNTAVAFLPNGQWIVHRKHRIVGWELANGTVAEAPRRATVFDYRGLRFGMMICADSGAKGIFDQFEAKRCDAVLTLTAGLGDAAKGFHQRDLAKPGRRAEYLKAAESVCFVRGSVERALRHDFAVAAVNQCGYDERLGYFQCGHSSVVNRTGEITALIPGRFVFEHLRPELAVGVVEGKPRRR